MLRSRRPSVLVEAESSGASSVLVDVTGGVRTAMDHLLGLGHRRIGHVAADYAKETFDLRRLAWLEAMSRIGEPPREVKAKWDLEAAQAAVTQLLVLAERPTALLCDDDLLAASAYRAGRAQGLSIPEDLSIIGFDDIPLARLLEPELTTIALPALEIGTAAGRLLLDRLATPDAPPRRVEISLPLRIRASTSAPPSVSRSTQMA